MVKVMESVRAVQSGYVAEIDFDALGRSGVYLVCGDTGAGKTMIFDAICFALFLYGQLV